MDARSVVGVPWKYAVDGRRFVPNGAYMNGDCVPTRAIFVNRSSRVTEGFAPSAISTLSKRSTVSSALVEPIEKPCWNIGAFDR